MTPVVNGLRNDFEGGAAFQSLNATSGEGKRAFDAYGLPGHPSFVLLDIQGEVIWRAFGPQSKGTLQDALEDAIDSISIQ